MRRQIAHSYETGFCMLPIRLNVPLGFLDCSRNEERVFHHCCER